MHNLILYEDLAALVQANIIEIECLKSKCGPTSTQ